MEVICLGNLKAAHSCGSGDDLFLGLPYPGVPPSLKQGEGKAFPLLCVWLVWFRFASVTTASGA